MRRLAQLLPKEMPSLRREKMTKRRGFDDKVAPAILVDGRGLGIYW